MANVNIIFSTTTGGPAITTTVDHGNASNGETTTEVQLALRHDGVNEITDASLYIREYGGTYTGNATAAADFAELLAWGDASTEASFGGFMVHMEYLDGFASDWPVYTNKSTSETYVCRNGVADSIENAVLLTARSGCSPAGTIAAGTPDVSFMCRVKVPTDEDTVGIRQWDQVVAFNFTS